jgi:DNA polymerase
LQELQARAAGCVRCPRHGGRQQVVHGSGDPNARLLVLLEAPSASDETAGQVATGPAGQLLDAMLAAMGLRRDQVWLCLLVQCRDGDRAATTEEAMACSGWLRAQWEIVQPAAILAMGTLPAQLLARQASPLAELRGRWLEVRGTPAVATWAPSDLLAADKALKRQAWDDLRLVMARLGLQR